MDGQRHLAGGAKPLTHAMCVGAGGRVQGNTELRMCGQCEAERDSAVRCGMVPGRVGRCRAGRGAGGRREQPQSRQHDVLTMVRHQRLGLEEQSSPSPNVLHAEMQERQEHRHGLLLKP